MTDRLKNDEFLERIGPTLRRPEPVEPTFVARVMDAVRAEAAALGVRPADRAHTTDSGRSWWRRRRTLQVSPLAILALAASFAGVVCLGTLGAAGAVKWMRGARQGALPVAAASETVHVVRFTFARRTAQSVALVGDFNAWTKDATPLVEMGEDGAWSVSVPLRPGRHEYAFIVDGREWTPDPFAVRVSDEFGTESSVVVVGDASSRRGPTPRATGERQG